MPSRANRRQSAPPRPARAPTPITRAPSAMSRLLARAQRETVWRPHPPRNRIRCTDYERRRYACSGEERAVRDRDDSEEQPEPPRRDVLCEPRAEARAEDGSEHQKGAPSPTGFRRGRRCGARRARATPPRAARRRGRSHDRRARGARSCGTPRPDRPRRSPPSRSRSRPRTRRRGAGGARSTGRLVAFGRRVEEPERERAERDRDRAEDALHERGARVEEEGGGERWRRRAAAARRRRSAARRLHAPPEPAECAARHPERLARDRELHEPRPARGRSRRRGSE